MSQQNDEDIANIQKYAGLLANARADLNDLETLFSKQSLFSPNSRATIQALLENIRNNANTLGELTQKKLDSSLSEIERPRPK